MRAPIPHDYHIHTNYSCDCQESMASMCRQALELGIPEIGFSDHFDLIPLDPCFDFFRAEAWWEELQRCRQAFAGSLTIRAGIEVGEPHRFPAEVQALKEAFPWDYLMASVHWVGESLIFEPGYFQQPPEQAYRPYFREVERMVTESEFDILGHLDIVKRYGFDEYGEYRPESYEDELRAVLSACASAGIALEINSGTLRRPVQQFSPGSTILEWFRQEGGQWVTLGSDAHRADHLGFGLERAIPLLAGAGFEQIASFHRQEVSPRAIARSGGT